MNDLDLCLEVVLCHAITFVIAYLGNS